MNGLGIAFVPTDGLPKAMSQSGAAAVTGFTARSHAVAMASRPKLNAEHEATERHLPRRGWRCPCRDVGRGAAGGS